MPGPRRSLASPVVSGVLCPCGSPRAAAAAAPGPGTESGGGSAGPGGRALCEASEQDRRLRALFQKLDVNRDGALCIHDLAEGLGRLGLHRTELDLLISFFACHAAGVAERNRSAGTGAALAEGSTVWMLFNNPVFLLKPLSVSIVPQPFASSADSSATWEEAG